MAITSPVTSEAVRREALLAARRVDWNTVELKVRRQLPGTKFKVAVRALEFHVTYEGWTEPYYLTRTGRLLGAPEIDVMDQLTRRQIMATLMNLSR